MELIKRNIPGLIATLIVIGLMVFAFVSCTGPQLEITNVQTQAQPPQAEQGGPAGQQQITTYKVTLTVQNKARGTGQAQITVRMIDKQDGKTVAEDTQQILFADSETQDIDFNFDLPPGNYDTTTDLHYPPD